VPELHHRRNLADLPRVEAEEARYVLFEAVASIVRALATEAGALLVVDDLHWAHPPTLLMLRHLVPALAESRTLVVATTRGIEQTPNVEAAVAALRRENVVEDIPVRGVALEHVGAIVSTLTGHNIDGALIRRLHAQTEGNPLFIGEIVRHGGEALVEQHRADLSVERVALPREVRDVIARRLRALSDSARRVLRVAAVIGPSFDIDLLEAVTGDDRKHLITVLEEAVRAHVVVESATELGRFGFAHALIRSSMSDEMTRTGRAVLHKRIGEAIEHLFADEREAHLSTLALHFLEAGPELDAGKAVRYARRAAEGAIEMLAYEDAIDLCTRALRLLDRTEAAPDVDRCRLLLLLGHARHHAGEIEPAKQAFEIAAALAQRLGLHAELAHAAIEFGGRIEEDLPRASPPASASRPHGVYGQEDERKIALLERALGAVADQEPALRARLLARLATAKFLTQGPAGILRLSEASLAAARESSDDLPRAEALIAKSWALWTPDHTERRLGIADELVRLADRIGDPLLALQAKLWRVVALAELSQLDDVEEEIARSSVRGLKSELQHQTWRCTLALLRGQLDEAEQRLGEVVRLSAEAGSTNMDQLVGIQTFALMRERGQLAMIRTATAEMVARHPKFPGYRAALALTHAESGFEDEARREFEIIAADGWAALPRDFTWLPTLSTLAPTCALLGASNHAEKLYALLLPYAHRAVAIGHFFNWIGPVSQQLGDLAYCAGRIDRSIEHFEDALRRSGEAGARLCEVRAQHGLAKALLARGGVRETARARAVVKEALPTTRKLGLTALEARLRELDARPQVVGANAWQI
jgi:tetratricopeptide (TPR) repeat protein